VAEKPVKKRRRYLAYLLRLWQEGEALGEPPLWRASLQRPQSEELRGFASLADLFSFLEAETASSPPGSAHMEGEKGGESR
jgi:hypothetical protein